MASHPVQSGMSNKLRKTTVAIWAWDSNTTSNGKVYFFVVCSNRSFEVTLFEVISFDVIQSLPLQNLFYSKLEHSKLEHSKLLS